MPEVNVHCSHNPCLVNEPTSVSSLRWSRVRGPAVPGAISLAEVALTTSGQEAVFRGKPQIPAALPCSADSLS